MCVKCAEKCGSTIASIARLEIHATDAMTTMRILTNAKVKEDVWMSEIATLPITECLEIKRVCERYGYGNVMEWASALWRYSGRKEGFPESGCFVPTCPDFIKPEYQCPEQHLLYDRLVSKIMEEE